MSEMTREQILEAAEELLLELFHGQLPPGWDASRVLAYAGTGSARRLGRAEDMARARAAAKAKYREYVKTLPPEEQERRAALARAARARYREQVKAMPAGERPPSASSRGVTTPEVAARARQAYVDRMRARTPEEAGRAIIAHLGEVGQASRGDLINRHRLTSAGLEAALGPLLKAGAVVASQEGKTKPATVYRLPPEQLARRRKRRRFTFPAKWKGGYSVPTWAATPEAMARRGDVVRRYERGHPEFEAKLDEAPDDWAARLVYADWLDENGDPELADAQRWLAKYQKHPYFEPDIDIGRHSGHYRWYRTSKIEPDWRVNKNKQDRGLVAAEHGPLYDELMGDDQGPHFWGHPTRKAAEHFLAGALRRAGVTPESPAQMARAGHMTSPSECAIGAHALPSPAPPCPAEPSRLNNGTRGSRCQQDAVRRYALALGKPRAMKTLAGEAMYDHPFLDGNGQELGRIRVVPRGDELHVHYVSMTGAAPGEHANELGPQVRSLMPHLAAAYPQANFITGKRISGARQGAVRLPLRRQMARGGAYAPPYPVAYHMVDKKSAAPHSGPGNSGPRGGRPMLYAQSDADAMLASLSKEDLRGGEAADHSKRKIAADALDENGRGEEAAHLRAGTHLMQH